MSNKKIIQLIIPIIGIILYYTFISSDVQYKKIESTSQRDNKTSQQVENQSKEAAICSWNLQNFGKSKKEAQLNFIAQTISDYDVVAIQEIVGNPSGEKTLIKLHHKLDSLCKDCLWDYEISQLTVGNQNSMERYAYLWKSKNVKKEGAGWLDQHYSIAIEREPFMSTFSIDKKEFTLVNFHAVPKKKQPETEIKYLKFFPENYPEHHLIFLGDFNLKHTHSVYTPLKKMGYQPALADQKTTMKMKCVNGECLASAYDNFFYQANYFQPIHSKAIPFYHSFSDDLIAARKISDHLPITFTFSIHN